MKLTAALPYITVASMLKGIAVDAQGQMVKMCLFYDSPSGHARSDPIITQQCASGHVHTFYGPQDFHPNTTYEDLLAVSPQFSTSPVEENQSLYWHPSIYRVTDNADGTETFTRVDNLESSPYYRWDNSVFDIDATPKTEAFPPHFRYIAASSDPGANNGGENGENMFTECCDYQSNGEEDCVSWNRLEFPTQTCDFLGIALAGPTCWNGDLGITNDHKNHMAYTLDGQVAGECPPTHPRRLPQVQLFVRIPDYQGGRYQLSDGNTEFHFDFFNGWQEGKLQEIIDNCMPQEQAIGEYNPECDCTFGDDEQTFLTPKNDSPGAVCDNAVRRLILNEATDVTTSLPKDACEGPPLIAKSWDTVTSDLYSCEDPQPPTSVPPTPAPPTASPVSPTAAPVAPTVSPVSPTAAPTTDLRWVVCGRGVDGPGGLKSCAEGDAKQVHKDEKHEVRCCKEQEFDGNGWSSKCVEYDDWIKGKSKLNGACHETTFESAFQLCNDADGRLCTKEEVENSCTKGTGCGHDADLIWTCTKVGRNCTASVECCSGHCHADGRCHTTGASPTAAPVVTTSPTKSPSQAPTSSPTKAPSDSPTASPSKAPYPNPATSSPTETPVKESLERWVVCGRGVGDGLKSCSEGEVELVPVDEVHEVRCCVYEDDYWEAFEEDPFDEGWKQKCRDDEFIDVLGKSMFGGQCFEENFNTARYICDEAGGRLCSADELLNSCTKGTGCNHDREMIWTCTGEYEYCEEANECCSGICTDNECDPWFCTEEYEPCDSHTECCSGICTGDGTCEPF